MLEQLRKWFPEWFRSILEPLERCFIEILAISLFTNLLALAVPIFTLQVYDRVVSHHGISTLVALGLGVLIALGFDFLLRHTRSRLLQHVALQIDGHLGRKLYDKFTSLPLQLLESKRASYWQTRFSDVDALRSVFAGPIAVLFTDLPFALVFLIVIAIVATPVVWVLLLFIGLFAALTYYSTQALNEGAARETNKQQNRNGLLTELINGRATVKALMIDKAMRDQYEGLHAEHIQEALNRGQTSDKYMAAGYTLSYLSTVTLIIIGAMAIIDREMTVGALVATTMLSSRIIAPVNQMLSSWKQIAAAKQSLHQLDQVFSLASERHVGGVARSAPQGAISVENVTFGYNPNRPPVINQLSLALRPHEMVGLVGRNGSGKTTLIKLLMGLYTPAEGRILIDNGDISQFTREELSRWIGYVPQDCLMFSGTIRENIVKAYPQASDDDILRAAKLSGADQFIIDLPDGYNTQVGEGGSTLSAGQRQRLAIARALLRNPTILLFDEISSNLDSGAEMALRNTLLELATTHTIVLSSHSSVLLTACHRLVVIERGQMVMMGPTQQVLAKLAGVSKNPQPPMEAQA